jgi:hypothetical protein
MQRPGAAAGGPLVRNLTLAAVATLLIWSAFRLGAAARIALTTTLVMSSILVFGTEGALGLAEQARQANVQARLTALTGIPFDRRTLAELVYDLRRSGVNAVPSIVPETILRQSLPATKSSAAWHETFFPLAGVSNRPSIELCNEDGQYRQYLSDEHGFSNGSTSWSGGPHDVVLIGDSFTHGYCVDVEASYAGQLRARWPGALNLGIGGDGPLSELATLTEYAAELRPRVVVWEYFENDMADLASERQYPLLMRYLEPEFSQGLSARQAEIDAAVGPWIERMWAAGDGQSVATPFSVRQVLTLFNLRQRAASLLRGRNEVADPHAQLDLFRAILHQARDRVQAWGGRLYFVFVPRWQRFFQPRALVGSDVREEILTAARSLGLTVVDLEPFVRNHPQMVKLFTRFDIAPSHFSPLGYALMANQVAAAVEKDAARATPGSSAHDR